MILLIPSYEPDDQLVGLVQAVRAADELHVVVVDDGSGPDYATIFQAVAALGCTVLTSEQNRGKGFALKVGFAHIAATFGDLDVVCADSDGQHRVADIMRVGHAVHGRQNTMVLGSRGFSGKVPLRSRFGNWLTSLIFRTSTGLGISDTQTGLRAYPASMLAWLQSVGGDRFEYETNLLLGAVDAGYVVEEIPIETVYLDGNASTHFRPVVDSARIYAPLVKFSLSSLAAFVIDFVLLFVMNAATSNLLVSVVVARVVSSVFNFTTNRRIVFDGGRSKSVVAAALRYFPLVIGIMAANYGLLYLLHERVGWPLPASKVVVEASLFFVSYQAQRRFIFDKPAL